MEVDHRPPRLLATCASAILAEATTRARYVSDTLWTTCFGGRLEGGRQCRGSCAVIHTEHDIDDAASAGTCTTVLRPRDADPPTTSATSCGRRFLRGTAEAHKKYLRELRNIFGDCTESSMAAQRRWNFWRKPTMIYDRHLRRDRLSRTTTCQFWYSATTTTPSCIARAAGYALIVESSAWRTVRAVGSPMSEPHVATTANDSGLLLPTRKPWARRS